MRHNKKFNHLSRTASHRHAMLANMAISLIMHKRITTTLAKAKALKKYVEPLITRSKEDTTNSRRVVFSYLQNKYAVKELFSTVAEKVGDRPGGYTRIIKLGFREGDAAQICFKSLLTSTRTWLRQRQPRRHVVAAVLQQRQLRRQRLQHLLKHRQKSQRQKKKRLNNFYYANSKVRVCQNGHILFFYRKAPTFSSQGFVMS